MLVWCCWDVVIVLILIVIGMGFFVGVGVVGLCQWQIVYYYVCLIGYVVEIVKNGWLLWLCMLLYLVVVVFMIDSGWLIMFVQGLVLLYFGLYEGDVVNVLYDFVMFECVFVDCFWDCWGLMVILFVIGVLFLVVGLFVVVMLWFDYWFYGIV